MKKIVQGYLENGAFVSIIHRWSFFKKKPISTVIYLRTQDSLRMWRYTDMDALDVFLDLVSDGPWNVASIVSELRSYGEMGDVLESYT